MAATLTLPELDVDVLGPLLVAEVEAYLASLPAPAVEPSRPRLTVPHLPRYGSVVLPWDHSVTQPERTWVGRILHRRPAPEVTVRQFLELMNSYIHRHGWTQGQLWDTQGRVCLLGARARVLAAGYGTPAVDEQARLLIGNTIKMPIDTWNDTKDRTVYDAHALLQATASRIR
jgi:hypothetical protein